MSSQPLHIDDSIEQILVITNPLRIKRVVDVDNAYSAMWEFDQWMRGEVKYRGQEWLQEVRDKFHEVLINNRVNLDDYA